jgi:hypothetical protein
MELPTAYAVISAIAIALSIEYFLTDDNQFKQIKATKTKWIYQ